MDKNELIRTLPVNACAPGVDVFNKTNTNNDIIGLFWEYIDFCLAMNFPSIDFLENNIKAMNCQNLYVNQDVEFDNIKRASFFGRCTANLRFSGYAVSRLYVKQNSKININASERSIIIVDALDTSDISVNTMDDAIVIVNLYSDATCVGATKVMRKNKETYDLQTR